MILITINNYNNTTVIQVSIKYPMSDGKGIIIPKHNSAKD